MYSDIIYFAATAAGFVIHPPSPTINDPFGPRGYGEFVCVCGRREYYLMAGSPTVKEIAEYLFEAGAFSAKHLKEDGYSEAEIDKILQPFKELFLI